MFAQDYKLELGAGLIGLSYPDYLGSKHIQNIVLPFPYIRYTGKFINIDKDGINRKILGINGLRIDISIAGSLPADSRDSVARQGMPDLDFTGEIGPRLIYNIYKNDFSEINFQLPFRALFSSDLSSLTYRGIVSSPEIKYTHKWKNFAWNIGTGAVLSDASAHDYFYGVSHAYTTPSRPYYETKSGLTALKYKTSMNYRYQNWWGVAFASYIDLSDAVSSNSPLVETKHGTYIGLGLAYIFYEH